MNFAPGDTVSTRSGITAEIIQTKRFLAEIMYRLDVRIRPYEQHTWYFAHELTLVPDNDPNNCPLCGEDLLTIIDGKAQCRACYSTGHEL